MRLIVHDVSDPNAAENDKLARLSSRSHATPTLLAFEGTKRLYTGPITSGSFCTTAVSQVLGIETLNNPGNKTLVNLLERGCDCRVSNSNSITAN